MNAETQKPGRLAPSVRHARQHRPVWWGGMLVSAVVHALVFFLWLAEPVLLEGAAPGERRPTIRAGGGAVQAIQVSLPERREIPPPPKPIQAIEVPEVEVREMAVSLPGVEMLPASQPAPLPGIGGGPGKGEGGEGGSGDGYTSPVPRSVVPQWDPPGSVRGMEVTVRVFVDAQGHPTGIVELDPPTPDARFNRTIKQQVRGWEYRPARRNGSPVEGWAEITFIF